MSPVAQLESLGLTKHEAAVYCALLEVERATASALAGPAGVDRTHVYAALKRLRERGLATASRDRVTRFSAVEPDRAFRQLLDEKEERLADGRQAVAELSRKFRDRKPTDSRPAAIEVMASSNPAVYTDVRRRFRKARKEVLSVYGRQYRPRRRRQSKKADDIEVSVIRRGVPARCVYAREVLSDEFERGRLVASVRAGEQARVADEVPFNILVVDDDLAVFTLPDGDGRYTVYRLNDPKLVMVFRLAFEQLWSRAADPGPYLEEE